MITILYFALYFSVTFIDYITKLAHWLNGLGTIEKLYETEMVVIPFQYVVAL